MLASFLKAKSGKELGLTRWRCMYRNLLVRNRLTVWQVAVWSRGQLPPITASWRIKNKKQIKLNCHSRAKTKIKQQTWDMQGFADFSDRRLTEHWQPWSQLYYQGTSHGRKQFWKKITSKLLIFTFLCNSANNFALWFYPVFKNRLFKSFIMLNE